MLSLLPLTLLATLTLAAPNAGLTSALSSLSSLFTSTPTNSRTATPTSFCCASSCPPAACNLNYIIPTDLAYAFPAPSESSTPSTSLILPCCHANCPDGACRTTPIHRSERPSPTQGNLRSDTANIVVGCCRTCHNCDQAVTSIGQESFLRDAIPTDVTTTRVEEAVEASITPSPSLQNALGLGSGNDKFPHFPHAPDGGFLTDICAGCGTCTPCDFAKVATWIEFFPHPTDQSAFSATATTTSTSSSPTNDGKDGEAEPTIHLASTLVNAINGKNQDVLPIILQTNLNSTSASEKPEQELRTLLATIDLKLQENYISRRLLAQLHRLNEITPYPKPMSESTAILSPDLDEVSISATIVLDIVAGNNPKSLFRNVRFSVFGKEDDGVINADVGEVILGTKVVREMGGMAVYGGFRGEVQEGVRVLEIVHFGRVDKGGKEAVVDGEGQVGHDEL